MKLNSSSFEKGGRESSQRYIPGLGLQLSRRLGALVCRNPNWCMSLWEVPGELLKDERIMNIHNYHCLLSIYDFSYIVPAYYVIIFDLHKNCVRYFTDVKTEA